MITEGISAFCYVLVFVEILLIYFGAFDFTQRVISMLLLALEITLILASYSSLKNVVAGLSLIFTDRFQIGSLCRIGYFIGTIQSMSLRATMLKHQDGSIICMPNAIFLDKYHQNLSARHLFEFEIHFRIDPATKLAQIEQFMETLHQSLRPFVISNDPVVTPTRGSIRRLIRSISLFFEEDSSSDELKPLVVVLTGLHQLHIRCLVRQDQDGNLAQVKSSINLEILSIAQDQKIRVWRSF